MSLMRQRMFRQNRKVQRNKMKEPLSAVYPKIIQIGNSLGVILRKFILDDIDWRRGDSVEFEYDPKEKLLKIRNYSAEQREHDRGVEQLAIRKET